MKRLVLGFFLLVTSLLHGETLLQSVVTGGRHAQLRAISPDGRYVAVVTDVSTHDLISIFDIQNSNWVGRGITLSESVAIAFSPDSSHLLIGRFNGRLEAFDLVTFQKVYDQQLVVDAPISAIAVSGPAESQIFISSPNGPSHWHYPSFIHIRSFGLAPNAAPFSLLDPNDSSRFSSEINVTASYAVEADNDLKHIRLFNLRTGHETQNYGGVFAQSLPHGPQISTLPSNLIDIPRVGFSDGTVIALFITRDNALTWNEFNYFGLSLRQLPVAYVDAIYSRESQAISADGNSVLAGFSKVGLAYRDREPRECAAWLRNVRHSLDVETFDVGTPTQSGTVLLSRDGKTAVTMEPQDKLRIWRLP